MNKRFLAYFILALVVFQSAAGIADVHQSHQSGIEHLFFEEHQHSHEDAETNQSHSDASEELEKDCHHCCHCHGYFNPAVLLTPLSLSLKKPPTSPISDYNEMSLSEIINPLLRPPIEHA